VTDADHTSDDDHTESLVPDVIHAAELSDGELSDAELSGAVDPMAALMGGGGFDLGSMMQFAQQAADQVAAAQESLLDARIEGTAGGGVVSVTLNGHLHLVGVRISPDAVDPSDLSMLEDLIVAAFADAQQQVADLQGQLDPLGGMGGMGGLGGLLGGA
jgi:DNA-binding YbaB/EbfC family protein